MTETDFPHVLIDGSEPARPDDVFATLGKLDIVHSSITHAAMRTVQDSRELRNGVLGGYSKNLFLRNKKGRMLLVTLREDRMVDLKQLGRQLEWGKPSFASAKRLMNYLGVLPGAVTPLAVINDVNREVTAVLDQSLLDLDPLHFHPCVNTMTTSLRSDDLLRYMEACHGQPQVIDFDAAALG